MTEAITPAVCVDPSVMGVGVCEKRIETLLVTAWKQLISRRLAVTALILKPQYVAGKGEFWIVLRDDSRKRGPEHFELLAVLFDGHSDQRHDVIRIERRLLAVERLRARRPENKPEPQISGASRRKELQHETA